MVTINVRLFEKLLKFFSFLVCTNNSNFTIILKGAGKMNITQLFNVDATIIVAALGLFGTVYTVKTNTLLQHNKQLMEMLEIQQDEIIKLKEQHAEESRRLEEKILLLTSENNDLRKEVYDLKLTLGRIKI